jgi:MerR family transcriptional regulator, light-induced transcriptional regulator
MSQEPKAGMGVYKINSIAELTGFNPNLLRAWERRYSLLEPERKSSGHRLYTDDDRQVLMAIRALKSEGRSIGEIAAMGRQALLHKSGAQGPKVKPLEAVADAMPPQVARLFQQIVAAALRLDSQELDGLLDESFATLDRETVFQNVMVPAIRQLGELWSRGEASVAHERLASELFCRRIYQWWGMAGRHASHGPNVLTACLPDEQHEMGALLVTYYLTRAGANVRYLGSLPLVDLELACRKTAPTLTMLSVTRPELFEVHRDRLGDVISRNTASRFVLGGVGLRGKGHEIARMGAELWPYDKPLDTLHAFLTKDQASRP